MTTLTCDNFGVNNRARGRTTNRGRGKLTTGKKIAFTLFVAVMFPLLIGLGGEISLRAVNGRLLDAGNWLDYWLMIGTSGELPTQFDELTGWANRPNAKHYHASGDATYTIDGEGMRINGQPRPDGQPMLAVGDSFTFGLEVDDADTWPAQLERMTGIAVVNGGVSGFGIDQAVLHAERLAPQMKPSAILFAFIADDIDRCNFDARQGNKPYFTVNDGELIAHNQPVIEVRIRERVSAWQWAAGYSALAEYVHGNQPEKCARMSGDLWHRAHEDGETVAAMLMARLAKLQAIAPVYVIAIDSESASMSLLESAKRNTMTTIETRWDQGPASWMAQRGHATKHGNEHIASVIAEAIE